MATTTTTVNGKDAASLQELISQMTQTLNVVGKSLTTLNKQSAQIINLGPTTESTKRQMTAVSEKLKAHHTKQEAIINDLRQKAERGRGTILTGLAAQVQARVQSQIAQRARHHAEIQIKDHLPIPLQTQSEECKTQIRVLEISLANSEARRVNARLDANDWSEPLKPVLKANGEESALFPADLMSLYDYNDETCIALLRDFEIEVDTVRQVNLNRFMAHIGLQFRTLTWQQ